MLFAVLGKSLAVLAVAGGGISAYYLTRSSNSGNTSIIPNTKHCEKPFALRIDGVLYPAETREQAEKWKKDDYENKGEVIQIQENVCAEYTAQIIK